MKVNTGAFARIAKALGLPYSTVYNRLKYGIPRDERGVMYPIIDQEIERLEHERAEKVIETIETYSKVIDSLKDARK